MGAHSDSDSRVLLEPVEDFRHVREWDELVAKAFLVRNDGQAPPCLMEWWPGGHVDIPNPERVVEVEDNRVREEGKSPQLDAGTATSLGRRCECRGNSNTGRTGKSLGSRTLLAPPLLVGGGQYT